LSTNSIRIEKEVRKRCSQCSCCGPGFWNILYNSLLNLKFTRRTKDVAFVDDAILAVRGKTGYEAEIFLNCELSKITALSKSNKITLNEEKSKVILISRRERKETKEITVCVNNKHLEQVNTMKYLGIIIDNKFKFSEHKIRS
jgi:xanthine dehydrogenase iron-sulfur cluster and FAD-binding subunit A